MATATVSCDTLNIRKGPGTNYDKLGTLKKGQSIEVTSTKNGWYGFKYNSTTGYVSSSYCKYSGGSSSSGGSAAASSATYKVTASSLNVRKGAGTSFGVLGQVSNGTTINANAESNGWVRFNYKNQSGWVSKSYLKAAGGSSGGSSSGGSAAKSGTVTCTTLNVRNGAGTNYGKIGTLSSGAKFSYTEESNGWLKISYGSGTGWISKAYTSVGGGSAGGGAAAANSDTAKALGNTAASTAQSLMSQYVSGKWTYSQAHRTSSGHYDCSSFCDRCWQSAGVSFGWTNSEGQALKCYRNGATVSETGNTSNVQPGDLLFYHTNWASGSRWKGINHVAIAISSGRRVDAGGTPVKEAGLGSPVFIGRPGLLKK